MSLFRTVILLGCGYLALAEKEFRTLDHLKPKISASAQAAAAWDLIARLIPERANEFVIVIDPSIGPTNRDTFHFVTGSDGRLYITATGGVAAAWGFHHFLKYSCGCHVSWSGDQLNVPSPLPVIPVPVQVTSNDKFRYYQNVCTVSYSLVWYNWTQWQREIDWMALNGINLPLAFTGQEAIFQRVFAKMGFSQKDLDGFFGGPAFLAWSRMGNIQGWGGPLSQAWINDQLALQHLILKRMRLLGMIPVLPAFAGHVPRSIKTLYPKANVTDAGSWSRFTDPYCCTYLLDFQDPLFLQIGKNVILEMENEFGVDHIYNADTFNEMTPSSSNLTYLKDAGEAIFSAMQAGDEDAVWLMQGWLFLNSFWQPPQAKALLTSVPQGKMIVLDLFSEVRPQYNRLDNYYGQPYIWCMLHNFGGTMDLYGTLENVNEPPILARNSTNSTMVGIGLTPEGIFQNYVMYDFMLENSWRTQPRNITEWISNFVQRRYGKTNKYIDWAWQLLKASVYNSTDTNRHHGRLGFVKRPSMRMKEVSSVYNCTTGTSDGSQNVVVTSRPQLFPKRSEASSVYNSKGKMNGKWGVVLTLRPQLALQKESLWYDPDLLYEAWDYFIMASQYLSTSLFRYDLVDVTRNSLEILSYKYYEDIVSAYVSQDAILLQLASERLLSLLQDLDVLLASDEHFLLGRWIEDAKARGDSDDDKSLLEYNARNQITLWGPHGEIVDYACKQWAGLVAKYYQPRWKLFVEMLQNCLANKTKFNQDTYNTQVFTMVEEPFTFDRSPFPTQPQGDSIALAKSAYMKYRPVMKSWSFQVWRKEQLERARVLHGNQDIMELKYGWRV